MRHLGILTLYYKRDGSFESGSFAPTALIISEEQATSLSLTGMAINNLHAEKVLAEWFTQQNEVELADKAKYKILFLRKEVSYYAGSIQEKKILLNVTFNEKVSSVAN